MHPLIGSFLRDILPANRNEIPDLSVRILGSVISFDGSSISLAFNQQLLPYIQAGFSVQLILPLDRYALARVLFDGGVYKVAETHALAALKQLHEDGIPPENQIFLQIKMLNGQIWRYMRRYAAALQIQEEVVKTYSRVFGEEHPGTLDAMINLAITLQNQGDYIRSVEIGERVLEIRRRVLGKRRPDTLNAMSNLALVLQKQGNYVKAARFGEQVLNISRKVLGEEHPYTLVSMSNLALAYKDKGNTLGQQSWEVMRSKSAEKLELSILIH